MSSVVVTGMGVVSPAGVGAEALSAAIESGTTFLERKASEAWRSARVNDSCLSWPNEPMWQAVREYSSLATRLSVAVSMQALTGLNDGVNRKRAACVLVTGDDWSDQNSLDNALLNAASFETEPIALFNGLDDQFLLRSFRWAIGASASALSGFSGPSVNVDCPDYGGLSGLRHAFDLILSREVDAVLLVAIASALRTDTVAWLHRLAAESGDESFALGQGAAALLIERESVAKARGAQALARMVDVNLRLSSSSSLAAQRVAAELQFRTGPEVRTWSAGIAEAELRRAADVQLMRTTAECIGSLLHVDGIMQACLGIGALNQRHITRAQVFAAERFWATGGAGVVLEAVEQVQ